MEAEAQPFPRIYVSNLEGRVRSVRYQKLQLRRLHDSLLTSEQELLRLIVEDARHTRQEAEVELLVTLSDLVQIRSSLDSEEALLESRQIELGKDNHKRQRSLGLVYIVPSKHTQVYSVISPVCAAIAAGSCVIVEVSVQDHILNYTGRTDKQGC